MKQGDRRRQNDRERSRAAHVIEFFQAIDRRDRWTIRRSVVVSGRETWVYTALPSAMASYAPLEEACRALLGRFPWTRAVGVIDRERTILVSGDRRSPCGVTKLVTRP